MARNQLINYISNRLLLALLQSTCCDASLRRCCKRAESGDRLGRNDIFTTDKERGGESGKSCIGDCSIQFSCLDINRKYRVEAGIRTRIYIPIAHANGQVLVMIYNTSSIVRYNSLILTSIQLEYNTTSQRSLFSTGKSLP